jgi:LysM repeat protein
MSILRALQEGSAGQRLSAAQRGVCVLALSALAACSTRMDMAPVVDRTGAPISTTAAQTPDNGPPPPGYYRVKPGDTLYRIALENGQNYHDIATWNNLTNPNQIEVGQLMRVAPPGANVAAATPGVATAPIVGGGVQTPPRRRRTTVRIRAWAPRLALPVRRRARQRRPACPARMRTRRRPRASRRLSGLREDRFSARSMTRRTRV